MLNHLRITPVHQRLAALAVGESQPISNNYFVWLIQTVEKLNNKNNILKKENALFRNQNI